MWKEKKWENELQHLVSLSVTKQNTWHALPQRTYILQCLSKSFRSAHACSLCYSWGHMTPAMILHSIFCKAAIRGYHLIRSSKKNSSICVQIWVFAWARAVIQSTSERSERQKVQRDWEPTPKTASNKHHNSAVMIMRFYYNTSSAVVFVLCLVGSHLVWVSGGKASFMGIYWALF